MIIFYDKESGRIIGAIEGRVHSQEQLAMWVGDPDKTERIVCHWKPKADGSGDFEPDHEQRDLFLKFDEEPMRIYEYRVDLESKRLVKA